MHEITGDLFHPESYRTKDDLAVAFFPDAVCITTNGFVKSNGCAVMGRGCAKEALDRWPGTAITLGNMLDMNGNITQTLCNVLLNLKQVSLVSFPVKGKVELAKPGLVNVVKHMHQQFKQGQQVPGWACKARLDLIKKSAQELLTLANEEEWQCVILPRPGCGAGELSWKEVKSVLEEILDDRFYCITFR